MLKIISVLPPSIPITAASSGPLLRVRLLLQSIASGRDGNIFLSISDAKGNTTILFETTRLHAGIKLNFAVRDELIKITFPVT